MEFLIKKPLVTEKNTLLSEQGYYAFEVDKKANKVEIKDAVEKLFEVKVDAVKTLICRGRGKRTAKGMTAPKYWKKALVKLKAGEQIKLFEGGAN